ncbi:MAG: hypothetical protein V4654_13395 [Bdellovibrionota bacterium]
MSTMSIDQWIQSTNAQTVESILVDFLLSDGTTYSGFINTMAYADDPTIILLTSRAPKAGVFVGKKIKKDEVIGFNFSVAARASFGVHHIRICEKGPELQFQHGIHDQQQILVTNTIASRDKFNNECLTYINKLSLEFMPNEQIGLILYRQTTSKYNVDLNSLNCKIREFLHS